MPGPNFKLWTLRNIAGSSSKESDNELSQTSIYTQGLSPGAKLNLGFTNWKLRARSFAEDISPQTTTDFKSPQFFKEQRENTYKEDSEKLKMIGNIPGELPLDTLASVESDKAIFEWIHPEEWIDEDVDTSDIDIGGPLSEEDAKLNIKTGKVPNFAKWNLASTESTKHPLPEWALTKDKEGYIVPYRTQRITPGPFDAFMQGIGGSWFIEPEIPFYELGYVSGAFRVAGYTTGMIGLGIGISYATGGYGLVPYVAVNARRIERIARLYNTTSKATGAVRDASWALQHLKMGQRFGLSTNTHKIPIVGKTSTEVLERYLTNVNNLGATQAWSREVIRKTAKESGIWVGIGQLHADEETSLHDRLLRVPQDAIGGALFSRGQLHWSRVSSFNPRFTGKTSDLSPRYKEIVAGMSYSFAAGAASPAMVPEEATWQDRLIGGAVVLGVSRLANGFDYKATRWDVDRALINSGWDDTVQRSLFVDALVAKTTQDYSQFLRTWEGERFVSKTGNYAVFRRVHKDDKGRLSVEYDSYHPNGKLRQAGIIGVSLDDFMKKYKQADFDFIAGIKNGWMANKDGTNEKIPTFHKDKDVKTFLNNGKYVILKATGAGLKDKVQNNILKPGESIVDAMIREALALGYKPKDILFVRTLESGKKGFGIVLKNGKRNDGYTMSKMFALDYFQTQAGLHQLVRDPKNVKNVLNVKVYPRIAGSADTSPTTKIQGRKGPNMLPVPDGKGGTKMVPRQGDPPSEPTWNIPSKAGFHNNHTQIVLNNGRVIAVKSEFNMRGAKPSNVPKSLITEIVDYKLSGAYKGLLKNAGAWGGPVQASRTTEQQLNITSDEGRKLRLFFFGKTNITKLTEDEHRKYQAMLWGMDGYADNVVFGSRDVLDSNKWKVYGKQYNDGMEFIYRKMYEAERNTGDFVEGFGNWTLPMYRYWGWLGNKYNSPSLKLFSKDIINKVNETLYLRSLGDEHMTSYQAKLKTLGYSEFDLDMIDMMALIDPKMFGPLSKLTAKEIKKLQPLVKEHSDFMDTFASRLFLVGAKERYIDPKTNTLKWRDITLPKKGEVFMPRTITDELADVVSNQEGAIFTEINKSLRAQFPKPAGFSEKEYQKMIMEKFMQMSQRSQRHGIYGTQYSRTFDLEPVYFLDRDGNIIKTIEPSDYRKQVGQKIGDKNIVRRIESYDMSYSNSMDRYISRVSHIIPNTRLWGYEGLWSNNQQKVFGQKVSMLRNKIDLELPSKDALRVKEQLTSDLEWMMGLNQAGPGLQKVYSLANGFTAFTAVNYLSGPISPFKNWLLGETQTIATFGLGARVQAGAELSMINSIIKDNSFRAESYNLARLSGARQAGQKLIDTATLDLSRRKDPSGALGKVMTFGMSQAEIYNRYRAAVTGQVRANNSLHVLTTGKASPFLIGGKAQQMASAQRFLRDTMMMSDKAYYDAVRRGNFTRRDKIFIQSRSHAITQGLTEVEYMPKIFSNQLVKPLTLFTRIATSVTDNVYHNVIKVARDLGDPGPMLRYTMGAYASGNAIEHVYYSAYNIDEEKFRGVSNQAWDELVRGEFMGVFQFFNDMAGGQNPMENFANIRQALAVLEILKQSEALSTDIVSSSLNDNPLDDYLIKDKLIMFTKDLAKLNAMASFTLKTWEGRAQKNKHYKDYNDIRKWQLDYERRVLGDRMDARAYISQDEEKSQLYQLLKSKFYTPDVTPEEYSKLYWATVQYLATQQAMSKNERLHDEGAFLDAVKDVDRYIKSFAPRKLSDKVGTQAGTFVMTSDWTDFTRRLSEDELQKIEDTEEYFWDRRFELANEYYSTKNYNKYMRHWTTKPSTLRFLGPKERRIKK